MKKIRMKLLGLLTAALILFGGMTGLTAALAEDTTQEAPVQEEYREDSEETGDENEAEDAEDENSEDDAYPRIFRRRRHGRF